MMNLRAFLTALALVVMGATALGQTVETVFTNSLQEPYGIAAHPTTNLIYVTSGANNQLVSYNLTSGESKVLGSGGDGVYSPQGVVYARGGIVYANAARHTVEFIAEDGTGPVVLAGSSRGFSDGIGTAAAFSSPAGIAVDAAGNLYVADSKNNAIRRIDPDNRVTTLNRDLNEPAAVAIGPAGRIFVADTRNHVIREILPSGTTQLLAGRVGVAGSGSGLLRTPRGLLWVGGDTGLLVSDSGNHALRALRFSATGDAGALSTIAGTPGNPGLANGPLGSALFNGPMGLARGIDGTVLVADLYNGAVRRIRRGSVAPLTVQPPGGTFSNTLAVAIHSDTKGAQFAFTTDGTDPVLSSPSTTGGLVFTGGPIPLKVRGWTPDADSTEVVSNYFTFFVNPLTLTADGILATDSTFTNEASLVVSSLSSNVVVRYTTDGSAPTTNSPVWKDRWYSTRGLIQLIAFRDGFAPSPVLSNRLNFAVAPVQITPGSGVVTNDVVPVNLFTGTTNSAIYWTIDGTVPSSTNGTRYTGPFLLGTNGTLQARAYRDGFEPSPVTSAAFSLKVASTVLLPGSATTNNVVPLTISTATPGAAIYWTIDGSIPSAINGYRYTNSFPLGLNGIVTVRAFRPGFVDSEPVAGSFSLTVAQPRLIPATATSNNPVRLKLESDTLGAKIYWSMEDPTVTTNSLLYTGPFDLGTNGIIWAKAFRDGFVPSSVASGQFTLSVAPLTLSPLGARSNNPVRIELNTVTTNAQVYWTLDGSDPTPRAGTLYKGPFYLATNGVLTARAYQNGFIDSPSVTAGFDLSVAAPSISPPGATANNGVDVTLKTLTTGAQLYWTIDGSEPTPSNGVLYSGPFTLATNGLLQVRGYRAGFVDSPIVSNVFNLNVGGPLIKPAGATTNNAVPIVLTTVTTNAQVYWTIDGSEPTPRSGVLYTGPFLLGTNGVLQVRAYRNGFVDSVAVSNSFNLTVTAAKLTPSSIVTNNPVRITLETPTTDARIYWTVNGPEPTPFVGTLYSGPFFLGTNGLLQTRAYRDGFIESAISSGTYNLSTALPRIVPAGLTTNNPVLVTLLSATVGAQIYWTIDGSEPTQDSGTLYSAPFLLGTNGVLQVRAYKNGFVDSSIVSANFSLGVTAPTIKPNGATTNNTVPVTLTTPTAGAKVYWTIDGTDPSPDNGTLYVDTFVLGTNGLLKARAYKDGFVTSAVVSANFALAVNLPVIKPNGATTNNTVPVIITSSTVDARIYWTIDGTDPATDNGTLYTGPFVLGTNGVLKVKAFKNGFVDSPVVSANFALAVSAPVIKPTGASTNNTVPLTITSSTVGARIYWTIDGTDPAPDNGTLYTDPFVLGTNGVLKVKAFKNGFVDSPVVSATFGLAVTAPLIRPEGATTNNTVPVTLTTTTLGAQVYWTIDGTEPDPKTATLYTNTFVLGTNGVLKAKAFKNGFVDSSVVSATFGLAVTAPLIRPEGATTNNTVPVTLTTTTLGAQVYWTIDGTEPDPKTATLYTGPFVLGTNGLMKVKAFKNGFVDSAVVNANFSLAVTAPVIKPGGATTNNAVPVTLTTTTSEARIYWTIDGSDPTPDTGLLYKGPFILATNGVLQVRAYRNGFVDSPAVSNVFNLTVTQPVISPAGATNNNVVAVAFATSTLDATLIWTIDGSDPSPTNGTRYSGPFVLGTNGVLKVQGYRAGFQSSSVASNVFLLTSAAPVVSPDSGTSVNSLTTRASTATTNAVLRFTTDGSAPTEASPVFNGPLGFTTNTAFRIRSFLQGFVPSDTVARDFAVKVDAPVLSPGSGYFPNGATISASVQRADARLYYTVDGSVPTTNSTLYTGPFKFEQLSVPGQDLRVLQVRAFAINATPSDITAGQPFADNTVGIPRDSFAGIGSTHLLPVVVNLKPGTVLRSVQLRVEASPIGSAAPFTTDLRGIAITTKDFVTIESPVAPGASAGPSILGASVYSRIDTSGAAVRGMVLTAIGTNANLSIKDYGTLVLVAIPVPRQAKVGDRYAVSILDPSGTSDAQQTQVKLGPAPGRVLTVQNLAYRVGDSAPGLWYNAGEFGDGLLDNGDVNNAFYASLGVKVPFASTDAFDAMDAYPADEDGVVGGDGEIRFLDWQLILRRSIGQDTNVWYRSWSTGGRRTVSRTGAPGVLSAVAQGAAIRKASVDGWSRDASLVAEVPAQPAVPGVVSEVPVYVQVIPGRSIQGLQFRSLVTPGRTDLTRPVQFVPATGIGFPGTLQVAAGELGVAWSLGSEGFQPAIQGRQLLGWLRIPVPESAVAGELITVSFQNVDGAPDLGTSYHLESRGISLVVGVDGGSHPTTAYASDDWIARYLQGRSVADQAADADPDGDKVPNWAEYLAGTDPLDPASKPGLMEPSVDARTGLLVLRWLGVSGKTYSIERRSATAGGAWSTVLGGVEGRGTLMEYSVSQPATGSAMFYRLRIDP